MGFGAGSGGEQPQEPGGSLGASLGFRPAGMRGQNGAGTGTGGTGQGQAPQQQSTDELKLEPCTSPHQQPMEIRVMVLLICNPVDGELSPLFLQLGLFLVPKKRRCLR